jgi:hypothetical protein
MMKRTVYQFEFCIDSEDDRDEVGILCQTLSELLPHAEVTWESAKSNIAVLLIEIQTHTGDF